MKNSLSQTRFLMTVSAMLTFFVSAINFGTPLGAVTSALGLLNLFLSVRLSNIEIWVRQLSRKLDYVTGCIPLYDVDSISYSIFASELLVLVGFYQTEDDARAAIRRNEVYLDDKFLTNEWYMFHDSPELSELILYNSDKVVMFTKNKYQQD